ncbi:nuclear pore complex protein Nup188 [Lycorma delicatula]|uniref:nuclear pore complex protein Nup188 n=1 Tax=Lycorma delicatula TaxID=130591 RepID=UPI003F518E34
MSSKEPLAYWRGFFELISGLKAPTTDDYMSAEISKVEQQLLNGLNYFKNLTKEKQENKKSDETISKRSKDSKLNNLVKKLSNMIRLEPTQTWEVLSNYLLYAFRGPAESLKKILISECKVNAVLSDIYCFYYRERMFLLKSFGIIITSIVIDDTSSHCKNKMFLEKLGFGNIYKSLIKQLDTVRNTESPDSYNIPGSGIGGNVAASSLVHFWQEHNLLEQIEILKLMILITPHTEPSMSDMDSILNIILKSSNAKRPSVISKYDSRKQSLLKSMWDLEVIHFIQLLSFNRLPSETIWCDENLFSKMDSSIRETGNITGSFQYEATGAILISWLLITYLSPFGVKDITSLQELGIAVKQSNPWDYLNKLLKSQTIMDESCISKIVNKTIYEVVYLTVINFGLDFIKDEPSIYSLTASLVKDDYVASCFWSCKNEGLILILEEAEMWFPAVWKPAIDILSSFACRGKSDCVQILKRLECKLKYCQKQTSDLNLSRIRSNVFYNRQPLYPLALFEDVVIPAKTDCTVTTVGTNSTNSTVGGVPSDNVYLHWNITLPFWRIVLNDIKLLNLKMVRTPDYVDSELRDRVIDIFKFSKGVLRHSPVISNDMILTMEEVFNIINKNSVCGRNNNLELLAVCLEISTCLIPLFPADILTVFEPLKFLPQIDHVVMTHIQCVHGIHYHGNYIKTLLELVEVKSGKFSLLISYLNFVLMLFKVEQVKVSWTALAGLMFVLRDVFPHYQTWYYVDLDERVEIGWLCIQLLHMSLNGSQEELSPPQTSVPKYSGGTNPTPSSGPTFNLMANSCLYSLLNKDAGLTLIRIVATGEQRLFDMVEKFPSWNSGKSSVLVNTVHLALSVLNRIILYKGVQQDPSKLSPTEEEIYKEPKDTDQYHCVLNVASYIHHSFNPKLRVLACRLLTRFADNTRLSLMLCTGLEPYTIRDMFLQPLYSDCESSQLKVAILQFIAKCIHRQASLAEAFLNVLELKECVNDEKEQEGDNNGVLTFALCVIDNEVGTVSDPVYHATIQLLHALWLEQCSVVLSYLRTHKRFWKNLCKPLFSEPREGVPVYTNILNILSTEFYWYGKEVHANLDDAMKKFLSEDNEYLLKWSLLCTNPSCQSLSAAKKRDQQSEELVVAWRELVVTIAKFLPDLIADQHKEMLAIHLLNGLSSEMASLLNMSTIITLSEAYVMLITIWKGNCCSKKKEVSLSQMIRVIAQLSQHYTYIHPKAVTNILALSARLLDIGPCVLPQSNEGELLMRSVCDIMVREIDTFMDKSREVEVITSSPDKNRQHLTLALCLALRLQTLIETNSFLISSWTQILRTSKLIQRLISVTSTALKNQIEPKLCMFILEFLLALTNKESLFKHIDTFDLHYYIWENVPSFNESYSSDKHVNDNNKAEWKPVYCRGLDLVTFLIENSSFKIKTSTYDFIELHGDYLRELLKLLEVSNDEADFELVSSGLRLLHHTIKNCNFYYNTYTASAYGLTTSVYQCLEIVVNLLLHPNTLVSQFFGSSPRRLLPFEQKPLNQKIIQKVQKAQIKLVEIYCECIGVLRQNFTVNFCDIISADRIGEPTLSLQPPIDYSVPVQHFSTILNIINLFTKVLTKNVRASTPVVGTSDDISMTLSKLSEVDHDDIRFALEISANFLISTLLLIVVDDSLTFRQKQLFTRDLSSEVNILLEYARRVSVDPTLHRLSVSMSEIEKSSDEVSPSVNDKVSKLKPLHWPVPSATNLIAADDTLDGIHYLDNSDPVKILLIPDVQTTISTDYGTLPMDFLAFAAQVFQLIFKMSEK